MKTTANNTANNTASNTSTGDHPLHPLIGDPAETLVVQEERERHQLWLRFSAAREAMDAWPLHWPLDGWLHLDGDHHPPFPVILVQFNGDGVGVVLGMEHPVPPGQIGDLTTQAHGAGCHHRPVRCQRREAYFTAMTLQYAALRFGRGPEDQ